MSDFLATLEGIIAERAEAGVDVSYTARLLAEGLPRVAQKVGEEAVETVIAALSLPRDQQIGEISDLLYHLLVMMRALNLTLDDVSAELERRHHGRQTMPDA